MSPVYIVAGCRALISNFLGELKGFSAVELGDVAIAKALKRTEIPPQNVEEVTMGQNSKASGTPTKSARFYSPDKVENTNSNVSSPLVHSPLALIRSRISSLALQVSRQLGLDESKVYISGGAITLGHPIGASGARILVTLIHNLERLDKKRGVAALCVGGGMGIGVAVQRI